MPWALLVVGCVIIVSISSGPGYCMEEVIWEDVTHLESLAPSSSDWKHDGLDGAKPWRLALKESKRALSVLSRWKPLTSVFSNGAGPVDMRRFSARSAAFPRDHSRALLRPLGAPLRWGKR